MKAQLSRYNSSFFTWHTIFWFTSAKKKCRGKTCTCFSVYLNILLANAVRKLLFGHHCVISRKTMRLFLLDGAVIGNCVMHACRMKRLTANRS